MSEVQMKVEHIPLIKIVADEEFNCRGPIAPIDVVDLAKDIEKNGLIQPAVVCPIKDSDKFKLIAGFRRYTAFRVLERDKIPCVVRSDMMNDVDARFFNLAENLKRRDLNTLQEAKALQKLRDIGVTETDASERLGKSRAWVQIRYMVLSLPVEIQVEIGLGTIKQQQIRELYTLYNDAGRDAVFEAAKKMKEGRARGLNVSVNKNRRKPDSKLHRKRPEIFEMMEHIQDSGIGNGIWTRCLAWCAGEISNDDLHMSLEQYARDHELRYTRPEE